MAQGRPARRAAAEALARQPFGRQVVIFTIFVAAAVILVAAVTGERGWLDVKRQRASLSRLRAEVAALQRENRDLLREVRTLRSDPFVIETIARERLGYARPGEIVLLVPPDRPMLRDAPPPRPEEGAP